MVDITENITDTNDDAGSTTGTAFLAARNNIYIGLTEGYKSFGGVRFQTINLDQGVTIDLANLIIEVTLETGAQSLKLYADDVDDAVVWSTSSRMRDITKTTASTTFAPTSTGSKTIDITTTVKEIVDRGSWAANNDMRFAFFYQVNTDGNVVRFDDYGKAGGTPAVLEIDFTAGASPIINLVMAPHIPA